MAFHYIETVQNTFGDADPNGRVQLIDRDTEEVVDIFQDRLLGTAWDDNFAEADERGLVSIYVADGFYHADFYSGTTFSHRIEDIAMVGEVATETLAARDAAQTAATNAATSEANVEALVGANNTSIILANQGYHGADNLQAVIDFAGGAADAAIYDVSDLSTLWKDTGGTMAAAVGDTVLRVDDKSGNGHHLVNGVGGTLAQDASGRYYLDCGSGALYSALNITVTHQALLVAAIARTVNNSWRLICVQNASGDGIYTTNLSSLSRITVAQNSADGYAAFDSRSGVYPIGQPGVIDYCTEETLHTSWQQGSGRSNPETLYQFDNGIRSATTPWTSGTTAASCSFGINTGGFGGTAGECHFYGGIFISGAVPTAIRFAANKWAAWLTGQLDPCTRYHDVFIVQGQSNAQGATGTGNSGPTVPLGRGSQWSDLGILQPLSDPVQQIGADTALDGSAWPTAANTWFAASGNPACFVGTARSGGGIFVGPTVGGVTYTWQDGGGLVELSAQKANEAMAFLNVHTPGARLRGIIWCGGEQDVDRFGSGTSTVSSYAADIESVRSRTGALVGDADIPMFIISADRTTTPAQDANYSSLRDAQAYAASNYDNIYLATTYQDYAGNSATVDGIHWDQTSQNEVGETVATYMATHFGFY